MTGVELHSGVTVDVGAPVPVPRTIAGVPVPSTMDRCFRTAGGLPVPRVASWSGEDGRCRIRWSPLVQAPAVYAPRSARGAGTARLGIMDPHRARVAAIDDRCQVCWRKLTPGDRWLAWVPSGEAWMDIEGRRCPMGAEPPACGPCMAFALRVCPAMVTRDRADKGQLVLDAREVAPIVQFNRVDPGTADDLERWETWGTGIVNLVKTAVVSGHAYTAAQAIDRIEASR